MENKLSHLTGWALVGFTCLLAAALCVNAVKALADKADFAYWHWVTLAALVHLCRKTVSPVMLARAAVRIRNTRKRTARVKTRAILELQRALRGLGAHFNQVQFEAEELR